MKKIIVATVWSYVVVFFIFSVFLHSSLFWGYDARTHLPNLWFIMQWSILGSWIGLYLISRQWPAIQLNRRATTIEIVLGILTVLSIPYALFNFLFLEWVLRGGYPAQIGQGYFLVLSHGASPIALSHHEFLRNMLLQSRKVSGHWVFCHIAPLLILHSSYSKIWGSSESS